MKPVTARHPVKLARGEERERRRVKELNKKKQEEEEIMAKKKKSSWEDSKKGRTGLMYFTTKQDRHMGELQH